MPIFGKKDTDKIKQLKKAKDKYWTDLRDKEENRIKYLHELAKRPLPLTDSDKLRAERKEAIKKQIKGITKPNPESLPLILTKTEKLQQKFYKVRNLFLGPPDE